MLTNVGDSDAFFNISLSLSKTMRLINDWVKLFKAGEIPDAVKVCDASMFNRNEMSISK